MTSDIGLLGLLTQAQSATLKGDLAELARCVPLIEAALAEGLPADKTLLLGIRNTAERNSALLAAALKGVRSARRRIAAMSGPVTLSTYNAKGQREGIIPSCAGPSRRL